MSGIEVSITDSRTVKVDPVFFAPVMRFEEFILLRYRADIESLSKCCGLPIHSLRELVKAMESEFDRCLSGGMAGIKIGLAYRRPILFEKTTWHDAEKAFNRIYSIGRFKGTLSPGRLRYSASYSSTPEGLSSDEARPLENFMVHMLIRLAEMHHLPVQVHSGLQYGNENLVSNSDPILLTNLFMEYRDVKFDVFHGSYPYVRKLGVLAKTFPNVYADMCWMHIISPVEARRTLSEWLEVVPASKILGFGGDSSLVEETYGHAVMARENISRVLCEKVEEGRFTLEQAKALANMLLRENARAVFSALQSSSN
jgi:predicted TIM-barrel fold metal-dependent hydrolase